MQLLSGHKLALPGHGGVGSAGGGIRAIVTPRLGQMDEGDSIAAALPAGWNAPTNFRFLDLEPGVGITVSAPTLIADEQPTGLNDAQPAGTRVSGFIVVTFTATEPAITVEQVFSLGARTVAGPVEPPSNWILASGAWSDAGQWEDTAIWSDAA